MSSELPVSGPNLKGRYLLGGLVIWGPVFWAGMTSIMFIRHQEPGPGRDLFVWLLLTFIGCECVGFLVGVGRRIRAGRLARYRKL
jgi:hypothetical protein